jgi:hypothetical protein
VKVKRIEPGNPQELDKWIRAISDLHRQTEHFFWLSRQNKIQKSNAKTTLGISYPIRAPQRHRYMCLCERYNASERRVFFIYFKSSVKHTWFDAEFQLILSVVPQHFYEVPVVFAIST